jgi:hypothetical protein
LNVEYSAWTPVNLEFRGAIFAECR